MSQVRKSGPSLSDVHVPVPMQASTQPKPQKSRRRKPRAKLVHVLQTMMKAGKGYNPNRDKEGRFASGSSANPNPPDDWHEAGSHPHPWSRGVRYVQEGDAVGMYQVVGKWEASKLDPKLPDGISVTGIVGGSPKGGGAAVIRHLTRQADQHRVALYIHPKPFGHDARLNKNQLVAWYKRHGWVNAPKKPGLFGMMVRLPQTSR